MTDSLDQNIGFIGVGNMGFPMALRLIEAGYTVTVFDLNPEPLEQLSRVGANIANSTEEAARSSNVLLTSLPRPDHVATVMVAQETLSCMPCLLYTSPSPRD